EVFLSYRRWQQEQLAGWRRGRMLTIDYGEEYPALYRRRMRGTLRAYCRQMRFEGDEVYARPGRQDLTADVNFTDLRHWGDELGLTVASYGSQADFLRRWLPQATLRNVSRDRHLAALLDSDGAGGAFKALEQTRVL
ncbi:MAG: SAM-dependent methyltransferase, partial [Rhodospirillales bacterium]|nr:SAM-dependent methyltransferase [Acetobacter sp.]